MPDTLSENEILRRLDELAERAERDRDDFEPPSDPPDETAAKRYLRDGAGPAIWLYVEARSGGFVHVPPDKFDALEGAMNDWFELYAGCYGVDIDAAFTIREAAEALLDTHNIHDVARILTHVPDRHE